LLRDPAGDCPGAQQFWETGCPREQRRHHAQEHAHARAYDEHNKILELLTAGNISRACDILDDHIPRTKHFDARVNWSSGRSHRKDYKFRNYSAIFAD
jgi:DNA-binding GntR family transcriptional regulator